MRAIPDGYYQPIPEVTDEQRVAIHRLLAGQPEADMLERMLTGVRMKEPSRREVRDTRILELRSAGASYSVIIRELRVTAHTITNAIRGAA